MIDKTTSLCTNGYEFLCFGDMMRWYLVAGKQTVEEMVAKYCNAWKHRGVK